MGAALLAGLLLAASESDAAEASVGADIVSAYVWRGITFNDSLVVQPSVDVAHPSGLSFNIWGNFDASAGDTDGDGVKDVPSGDFQEIDLTVSYGVPVELLDVSVGLIDYSFPGGGRSTTEAFASAGSGLGDFLSLGLSCYYDFDEVEDYYLSLELGAALPVKEGVSFGLDASIGYAGDKMAAGGREGFHDYNLSASLTLELPRGFELGAFIAYTAALDSEVLPDQEVDLYGGLGLHSSF